jgi:hypothetical protein
MLRSPLSSPLRSPLSSPLAARRGGGAAFDPATLFASGELGAWYDRKDPTTMFQDINGLTAVTSATNPIGLSLDKGRALSIGSESVTNGDFSSSAGWTINAGFTIAGGVLSGSVGSSVIFASRSMTFVQGALYRVEVQIPTLVSGSVIVIFGVGTNVSSPAFSAAGTYVFYMKPGSGNAEIRLLCQASGFNGTVDLLSARIVAGGHAQQSTPGARPLYQVSPQRAVFDGVDDVLVATFTASLGSNCTVGRSIPGVGAQILTSQTIGTSYNVNTTDSGLVIVNRSLTTEETSGLTSYLEAAAFF